ncbi:MAG: RNA methyltransferase [Bacteroidales bacterium]|nr:RNA methyltransferase [Bacteroidales bacterium]MBN2818336.1 RNA methyltransferase [Bacteroidales bacterium]
MINKEQNKFEMVAKTFFGLEPILEEEIKNLGAEDVRIGRRMVSFVGDLEVLYKANIFLRTALRILKTVHSFTIKDQDDYYNKLIEIEWEVYLGLHHTFAIDSVVVNSEIFKNSLFTSQRAKDALVDRFRKKYHKRPLVNVETPDVLINIHINGNRVNVALDSSGVSLHRRGYRVMEGPAPINPVLAAALIKLSGWDPSTPFVDPMTGTGTMAIEAALIARNIPPGLIRKEYCFQNWTDYNKKLYHKILEEVELNDFKPQIFANDISEESIEMARQNAFKANITSFIRFSNKSFRDFKPRVKEGTVIINPPYGERMKEDKINSLYKEMGDILKEKYPGFKAWIISSNTNAMKNIGLKSSGKTKLFNGSLECIFSAYDLFEGGYKEHKTELNENKQG